MASSAPALGLNTILFKHVYCYMQPISGERLQDHWSSGIPFEMEFVIHRSLMLFYILISDINISTHDGMY